MLTQVAVGIDLQNDFGHRLGRLYAKNAETIIQPCINYMLAHRGPKFMTMDTHNALTYSQYEESQRFRIHCMRGFWGWESPVLQAIQEVESSHWDGDNNWLYTLEKPTTNMWEYPTAGVQGINLANDDYDGCGLNDLVRRWWEDHEFHFMGLLSDICVEQAMVGFIERGFKCVAHRDLCVGLDYTLDEVVTRINNPLLTIV